MLPVCSVKDVAGLHHVLVPAIQFPRRLWVRDARKLYSGVVSGGETRALYSRRDACCYATATLFRCYFQSADNHSGG